MTDNVDEEEEEGLEYCMVVMVVRAGHVYSTVSSGSLTTQWSCYNGFDRF